MLGFIRAKLSGVTNILCIVTLFHNIRQRCGEIRNYPFEQFPIPKQLEMSQTFVCITV